MSQRDIRVLVPAGGSVVVSAPGEFIYLKDCARALTVRVNGQAINMERGEKRREPGRFDQFTVDNSSATLPTAAVFVVGLGDYEKLIVSGEIYAMPGVIGADGLRRPDRRYWRDVVLNFEDTSAAQFDGGDVVWSSSPHPIAGSDCRGGFILNGVFYAVGSASGGWVTIAFDQETKAYLGASNLQTVLGVANPAPTGTSVRLEDIHRDKLTGRLYAVMSAVPSATRIHSVYTWAPGDSAWVPFTLLPAMINGNAFVMSSIARDPISRYWVAGYQRAYSPWSAKAVVYDDAGNSLHEFVTNNNGATKTFIDFYSSPAGVGDWIITCTGSTGSQKFWRRQDYINGVQVDDAANATASGQNYLGAGILDSDPATRTGFTIFTPHQAIMRQIALEDYTLAGRLYLTVNRARIVRPVSVPVYSEITHTLFDGVRSVSGEVIRLLCWVLLGREPDADYLDHVYQVELYPGANGAPETVITGGVESFAAAGVVDDYRLQLPTLAKMQIDF